MAILIKIKDKTEIARDRFCPPHTIPHKLPWKEKIKNEPCHIHNKKWRMMHHICFCKMLKCQNCEFMLQEYQKLKSEKKKND
ncbi:hypothetical protein HYW76_02365 [Candidatus Pacearchaeota archaeon]|nr:hypothetical protein [Candidatus Pacearchaeota archaeon]